MGRTLSWSTAGESHGKALVGILEGMPAGLELSVERVDLELARRQRGYGRGGRMKIETDRIELLGGTKTGLTLGGPIAFQIVNKDAVIEKLPVPTNPRPGHADLAGCQKFGHRDVRAILERASARETAARVALGAMARQLLEAFGIEVFAHTIELGGVAVRADAFEAAGGRRSELRDKSNFLSLDPEADARMRERVDRARDERDSLGGLFEIRALGLPPGLGSFTSGAERLTARLGGALLSIPAMKGVEFGLGFESARTPGSRFHDPIVPLDPPGPWGRFGRTSNRAGGLEGGMTSGEELVCRVAMKPIPSLKKGVPTVDFESGESVRATYQRSDVTSVPAAGVVGEAMVCLTLTAAFLEKFGGDSLAEVREGFEAFTRRIRAL
ncbi:MAG: chorismate synthase [Planctomycetes bacterium]|nr:chorismate synthase [Planctomycetota bacterium]